MEQTHLGIASDYKLIVSPPLAEFIKKANIVDVAQLMPKYEFISPSLALIIMSEIKKMLMDPGLLAPRLDVTSSMVPISSRPVQPAVCFPKEPRLVPLNTPLKS